MLHKGLIACGLAASFCLAPIAARADWDLRLYQPRNDYTGPYYPGYFYSNWPSAYYYPPFYNARLGNVREPVAGWRTYRVRR